MIDDTVVDNSCDLRLFLETKFKKNEAGLTIIIMVDYFLIFHKIKKGKGSIH